MEDGGRILSDSHSQNPDVIDLEQGKIAIRVGRDFSTGKRAVLFAIRGESEQGDVSVRLAMSPEQATEFAHRVQVAVSRSINMGE